VGAAEVFTSALKCSEWRWVVTPSRPEDVSETALILSVVVPEAE
jgi:hypothetical protein